MSLKSIVTSVENWVETEVEGKAGTILKSADAFVTEVFTFAATPTGQTIEKIIETFLPASVTAAVTTWLPVIFTDLKWATAETGKTPEQIIEDGLAYLASLTGNVKAAQANTFAALVSTFVSDTEKVGLTIQQALTAAQPVHAPLV